VSNSDEPTLSVRRGLARLKPRRRRDTWLHYATIVALVLQVVVAAFPEVCTSYSLQRLLSNTYHDKK